MKNGSSNLNALLLQLLRDRFPEQASIDVMIASVIRAHHVGMTASGRGETVLVHNALAESLLKLEKLKLVDVVRDRDQTIRGAKISDYYLKLQLAIGFSLTEAAQRGTLTINPQFGSPRLAHVQIFVIMPFEKNLNATYRIIKACGDWLDLKTARGDDIFTARDVIGDIWSHIYHAEVIVADCTGRNPNVFYELGIAHTLGKKVVLLARSKDDIPFDLMHLRYLLYNDDHVAWGEKLTEILREILSIPVERTGL